MLYAAMRNARIDETRARRAAAVGDFHGIHRIAGPSIEAAEGRGAPDGARTALISKLEQGGDR